MALEQTLEKIEADIRLGNPYKARDRLHGLIASYPDNLSLRKKLGDVYWQLQYPAMAGRYWYLEQDKTPEMVSACAEFERFCGHDPLRMLFALKFRGDLNAMQNTFAGEVLISLHERARKGNSVYVDFQKKGADRYIWNRHPEPHPLFDRIRNIACSGVMIIALLLLLLGLWTMVRWIFPGLGG
jgi:hypothetical protein